MSGREPVTIAEFQKLIEAIYFRKDSRRGLERTFLWFAEEVGELARDLLHAPPAGPPPPELSREFADVLAWLATLASIAGVDLEAAAVSKYGGGCPRCRSTPCACSERGATDGRPG